jgi:hypothetical protein
MTNRLCSPLSLLITSKALYPLDRLSLLQSRAASPDTTIPKPSAHEHCPHICLQRSRDWHDHA